MWSPVCFKQVVIKLCQIWQNGLWAMGWIVVLQCIAMILLNVMFFLHFALVFYETPERGKLAHRVESCWRSSDRWRWFLLPLKVLKLALEDSWMFIHILITFLWAHWKYLFLIALSFCQVCNPFNHLSRTFCFGCGLRSFWENPIKSAWSGTGVLRWV